MWLVNIFHVIQNPNKNLVNSFRYLGTTQGWSDGWKSILVRRNIKFYIVPSNNFIIKVRNYLEYFMIFVLFLLHVHDKSIMWKSRVGTEYGTYNAECTVRISLSCHKNKFRWTFLILPRSIVELIVLFVNFKYPQIEEWLSL